ncbi:ribosomal-processing cysteine protease Prp [Bacillota bacterium LX-D]|nr:ribosomal-processing cysteine protease Prp [Bacillota bacterium LX-D]
MVIVEIFLDDLERVQSFQVKGHANAGIYGQDIVCAAVSVLTQTALLGMEHYLTADMQIERKSGWLKCVLPQQMPQDEAEKAQIILQTMLLGLYSMEKGYQKYMKIIKRRWTACS